MTSRRKGTGSLGFRLVSFTLGFYAITALGDFRFWAASMGFPRIREFNTDCTILQVYVESHFWNFPHGFVEMKPFLAKERQCHDDSGPASITTKKAKA